MADQFLNQKTLGVSVSVDGENAPIFVDSGKLVIRESMERLVVSGEIVFNDIKTTFLAKTPFVQDSLIQISLQDDDNIKQIAFRPFTDVVDGTDNANLYEYKLDIISVYADPVLMFREFHSKRCKASDYVKYLADRLKLNHDIEDSKDEKVWINPNWKVGQMLRYLATSAISSRGSSGYMYYVTYDGTLVFKTVDRFFDESQKEENINFAYTTEELEAVQIKRNHFSSIVFGANYKEYSFFDLETSSYNKDIITYDRFIKKRALKSNIPSKYSKNGGSTYSSVFNAKNGKPYSYEKEVFLKTLFYVDTNTIIVTVKADPFGRKLGQIVNVNIPVDREDVVNFPLSGRYLIKAIVTKGIREFFQTLVLVRPGLNYLDKNDLL